MFGCVLLLLLKWFISVVIRLVSTELRSNSFESVWLGGFCELHNLVARLHVFYMYLIISG